MKKLGFLFSAMALAGLLVVACGDDDGGNDCDKAAAVMKTAMDGYCNGKSATCWACDCYNQGMDAASTGPATALVWSCETRDPVDPVTCDGSTLASAQTCLADEAACTDPIVAGMTTYCDYSAK